MVKNVKMIFQKRFGGWHEYSKARINVGASHPSADWE